MFSQGFTSGWLLKKAGATGFSAFFSLQGLLEPFSPTSAAHSRGLVSSRYLRIGFFRYGVAQSTDLSHKTHEKPLPSSIQFCVSTLKVRAHIPKVCPYERRIVWLSYQTRYIVKNTIIIFGASILPKKD